MTCKPIKNGIICLSKIEFNCPHCKKYYTDEDEKFFKRISKNKKGYTTQKCECGKKFGITTNFKGDMVGFELLTKEPI